MKKSDATKQMDNPEAIVQRQLDAYNARDIDVLMATYAPDAIQFGHPDQLLAEGHVEIRERTLCRFNEQNLRAVLLNRAVLGNTVVDHERITRTFPEGAGTLEIVAIYQVLNQQISKAWFISGTKSSEESILSIPV